MKRKPTEGLCGLLAAPAPEEAGVVTPHSEGLAGPQPVNAALEVIDDLSFGTIGPPCATDTQNPIVQITYPPVCD